jgi:hypothetical protein
MRVVGSGAASVLLAVTLRFRFAAAAAAFPAGIFHDALVAAFFDHRRLLAGRHGLEDLAAAGLIDVLFVRATVAIGDTFSPDALAMTGHTNVAALAEVLGFGLPSATLFGSGLLPQRPARK